MLRCASALTRPGSEPRHLVSHRVGYTATLHHDRFVTLATEKEEVRDKPNHVFQKRKLALTLAPTL